MKFNVLLLGPIGTGKTFSTRTLLDCGLELFYLATEPGLESVIGDLPTDKVHMHYVPPTIPDWDTARRNAELMNKMDIEGLIKMKAINKHEYGQFLELYSTLSNFKDDRTGEEFGSADSWGPERALIIDGLSGVSTMARENVVGAKPIMSQPEWQAAQQAVMSFLRLCTGGLKCTFVLISHMDRKENALTGGTILTVSTLGKAIAGDVPKSFDEVIYTRRVMDKFYWSTVEEGIDLKTRTLPFTDNLQPTFTQLFELGRAREKDEK